MLSILEKHGPLLANEKLNLLMFFFNVTEVAVQFINQLSVESPVLSALIYNVFYHHSAGRPHWSETACQILQSL